MLRQHTWIVAIGTAAALALLFVLVALFAGGGDEPEEPDEPEPTVRTDRVLAALSSAPGDLDPHGSPSPAALLVLDQVYDTLVRPDAELLPQPALAREWEAADDGLTWTFTLRDDVTFHDGSTLTSADVVASLERVMANGAPAADLDVVDELEAPEQDTVVFHLDRPAADLPARLGASPRLAIVPAQQLAAGDLANEPVGTGPFMLADGEAPGGEAPDDDATDDAAQGDGTPEDTTGNETSGNDANGRDEVALDRFDGYWGEGPSLEGVTFRVLDPGDALGRLRAGELDWVPSVPTDELEAIEGEPQIELAREAGIEYWHLAFNLEREPFDELAVRRAVGFALDRERIGEVAHPGPASPAQSAAPDASFYHDDHAPFALEPERSQRLLDDVGAAGLELELLVTDELAGSSAIADEIAEQLAEVGIEVEVRTEELEDLLIAQGDGDFDVFLLGWRGHIDPDALYHAPHHSEGERNYQGYADEGVDALLDAGREETEPEVRRRRYDAAVERIVRDAPYLYLLNPDVVQAWSAELEGVAARPDGRTRFDEASLAR